MGVFPISVNTLKDSERSGEALLQGITTCPNQFDYVLLVSFTELEQIFWLPHPTTSNYIIDSGHYESSKATSFLLKPQENKSWFADHKTYPNISIFVIFVWKSKQYNFLNIPEIFLCGNI